MANQKSEWIVDLENGYWYDNVPDTYGLDLEGIRKIEKLRSCRYVCEWNTIDKGGDILDTPVLLFWNDVAHPQGSNWMALYRSSNDWYVKDGITTSRLPIQCVVSNDKQVLFSKYRHDFRSSQDGSVTIDGGREYTRMLGNIRCERVWLLPQQGKLTIIDDSAAELLLSGMRKPINAAAFEYDTGRTIA